MSNMKIAINATRRYTHVNSKYCTVMSVCLCVRLYMNFALKFCQLRVRFFSIDLEKGFYGRDRIL